MNPMIVGETLTVGVKFILRLFFGKIYACFPILHKGINQ
jgi:hypothetical protein